MSQQLPPNVHISAHPCLRAKLAQLRSASTSSREVKTLVHEIALIVGVEATANGLQNGDVGIDKSPLGYEFAVTKVLPARISLMPILRSGLGMIDVEAMQTILPEPVPVHHLGLFRDKSTMAAVEYYNNLPYHKPSAGSPSATEGPSDIVFLVDPVIATGATACAAIDTLRDWGVKRIIMVGVVASLPGLQAAAAQWSEGVEIWVGGMDAEFDQNGMIKPGLGDIGDRLFLTMGK